MAKAISDDLLVDSNCDFWESCARASALVSQQGCSEWRAGQQALPSSLTILPSPHAKMWEPS